MKENGLKLRYTSTDLNYSCFVSGENELSQKKRKKSSKHTKKNISKKDLQSFHLQRNSTMESLDNKKKRKALRKDKKLIKEIKNFILNQYDLQELKFSNPVEPGKKFGSNGIYFKRCCLKQSYFSVYKKMIELLISKKKGKPISRKVQMEHERIVQDEWNQDCETSNKSCGDFGLDENNKKVSKFVVFEVLVDSIFELIDLWTISITSEEYILFIRNLNIKMNHPNTFQTDPYSVLTSFY